jgi:tRNA uridine 5-carbamoylmethylation protein Kti12
VGDFSLKNTKTMHVFRGLPGSGKSYSVNQFVESLKQKNSSFTVHSTDNYFMVTGEYIFVPERIGIFHKFNKEDAKRSCENGIEHVIIDNTNTCWKEIKPYAEIAIEYGYEFQISEPLTDWRFDVDECVKRNSHGVPKNAIERMLDRWESSGIILEKYRELASNNF